MAHFDDPTVPRIRKVRFKGVDIRYALVKTKHNQTEYHIVSVNDLENITGENYEYDSKYRVYLNGLKYKATLVAIGTETECNLIRTKVIARLEANKEIQDCHKKKSKKLDSKSTALTNVKSYIKRFVKINESKSESKLKAVDTNMNEVLKIVKQNDNKICLIENSIQKIDKRIGKLSSQSTDETNSRKVKNNKISPIEFCKSYTAHAEADQEVNYQNFLAQLQIIKGRFSCLNQNFIIKYN